VGLGVRRSRQGEERRDENDDGGDAGGRELRPLVARVDRRADLAQRLSELVQTAGHPRLPAVWAREEYGLALTRRSSVAQNAPRREGDVRDDMRSRRGIAGIAAAAGGFAVVVLSGKVLLPRLADTTSVPNG